MANLIRLRDILTVLEKGCWHGKDQRFNICNDCADDIRAYILKKTDDADYYEVMTNAS